MARPPLAALLVAIALQLPGTGSAQVGDSAAVWIGWTRPAADRREVGPLGLLPIEGWAAAGSVPRDVVLAIDVSASTLEPSGADIDGDGRIGRRLRSADDPIRNPNPRRLCTDPGDTIRAAELEAARHFAQALDPLRTRLSIVTFADGAEIRVPLTADPEAWRRGLDRVSAEAGFGGSATDLGAALDAGLAALAPAEGAGPESPRRERWIVMVSDGRQSGGAVPEADAQRTLDAAIRARVRGVRVHALALGAESAGEEDLYGLIAARSGGRFEALANPSDVVQRLAAVDLARIASIRIENRTTGTPGRAVRVGPDGRFDGVVALAPGANRIQVVATTTGGAAAALERSVAYEARSPEGPAEVRAAEEKLAWLRDRTVLLALEVEALQHRTSGVQSQLRVDPERPIDVAAPPPRGDPR